MVFQSRQIQDLPHIGQPLRRQRRQMNLPVSECAHRIQQQIHISRPVQNLSFGKKDLHRSGVPLQKHGFNRFGQGTYA